MARRFAFSAACVVMVAGCPRGVRPSQTPPNPPLLAARPGITPAVVIGGFLYPTATRGGFELDAPIRTTSARSFYFAFEANFRTEGFRTLALTWTPAGGGATIDVPIDAGPCDSADPTVITGQLRYARNTSLASTGRGISAAYSRAIEDRLDAGEALAYITCTADASGEVVTTSSADYNVAVLLPASVLGGGGGGVLGAMAVNTVDGVRSAPTQLTISKTLQMVAAVGDSVVWGQGITPRLKAVDLLAARVTAAVGPTAPVRMAAHSAGILTRTPGTTIRGTTGCPAPDGVSGEVPRRNPSVQCQLQAITALACSADPAELGILPMPAFFCAGDGQTPPPSPLALAPFDQGPRWDFVLLDGCINDIGPFDIVVGRPGLLTGADVTAVTTAACDLRLSLPDLPIVLPNAVIPITGYHLIIDSSSNPILSGCPPPPPPPIPPPPPPPELAAAVLVATFVERDGMIKRSAAFQSASDAILATSVAAYGTPDGRGTIFFVPISPSFGPGTAFLAPGTLLYPIVCRPGPPPIVLGPVDPVAGARALACAAATNPSGSFPPPPAQLICERASAFHPNIAGHAAIDALVGAALTSRGLLAPAP